MGTTWSVRLAAARSADLRELHTGLQIQLDLLVQQMSHWEPSSDISRYNRATAESWQVLPAEFAHVLSCALEVAEASEGAFDPTLGTLIGLWGFGPQAHDNTPNRNSVDAARQHSGWQRLQFEQATRRLYQPGGLQLDLSAIAKGYAVDHLAHWLRTQGIHSALVEVGGELYGYGCKPEGEPWCVLVEAGPEEDDHRLPPRILALDGLAVATSGDRWHHYTRNGRRYTHTLDPRSGAPLTHAPRAVSVIAPSAMQADAWATALSVLGVEAGFTLAERLDLAVRYLWSDAEDLHERMSRAFQTHLVA